MWNYLIPSKETYAIVGFFFMVGGWLNFSSNLWLGGIICLCSAGIMAHER